MFRRSIESRSLVSRSSDRPNGEPGAERPRRQEAAWLGRSLDGASALANAVGTLALLLVMVLVNADVVGRSFLDAPVRGTNEITRIAIVAIVYLQLSHALRAGRVTQSEVVLNLLDARAPRLARVSRTLVAALGAAFMALLFVYFVPEIASSFQRGRFFGTRGVFTIPLWPLNAMIALGAGLTTLQFARLALQAALGRDAREDGRRSALEDARGPAR